jgi:hypothetical protein
LVKKVNTVFAALNAAGIVPQINDGFRTIDEQAQRYENSKYGQVPIGPHEVGMAVDIQINYVNGKLSDASQKIVDLMKGEGFTWGGNFTGKNFDPVHFQLIRTPSASDVQTCTDQHPNPVDDRPGH